MLFDSITVSKNNFVLLKGIQFYHKTTFSFFLIIKNKAYCLKSSSFLLYSLNGFKAAAVTKTKTQTTINLALCLKSQLS
jgi:hypothetical protein